MNEFTHLNKKGRARMVDVSGKPPTIRTAAARGKILMLPQTLKKIKQGGIKKGGVLAVADVAAIMAAKNTPYIIPMCHPLILSGVDVEFDDGACGDLSFIEVRVTVKCAGPTGVEMEALTAAAAALLTIYDMCKAVDKEMTITEIELLEKTGGRSGHFSRDESLHPNVKNS